MTASTAVIPSSLLRLVVLAVVTSVALSLSLPVIAAPNAQGIQAQIVDIAPEDDFYASGEDATIEFVIRDRRNPTTNSGLFTYGASIVIENVDRETMYSSRDEGDDRTIGLFPGEFGTVEFEWSVPADAGSGDYAILGSLHDRDFTEFFDIWELSDGSVVTVEEGILMTIVPDEHDFGDIDVGDTPDRTFTVVNEGAGTLIWEVTDWPEDWLELVVPSPGETVRNRGRIRVEVRDDISFGEFEGEIVVESNGGDISIPVFASVSGVPNGEVRRVDVSGEDRYVQGERVQVNVRLENTAEVDINYRVTLIIESTGQDVYDSNREGEDHQVRLQPEDIQTVSFAWNIPTFAQRGDYLVRAELRTWNDFDCVIYPILDCGRFQEPFPELVVEETDTFVVSLSPPRISVEPQTFGFGNIDLGETPEARFQITNPGRGRLEWEVVSVPEWVELISPMSQATEDGEIVIRVSDSAPGGRFTGQIEVESTASDELLIIHVSVSIDAPDPTATPSPTPTQTPTPLPTPTPRPVTPTATPTPLALPPSVISGNLTVRNGSIPADARLVARIGSYESIPALIGDGKYSSLVVAPIGEEFFGRPIEFFLNGVKASSPASPTSYIPSTFRTVNLIFDGVGTPEPDASDDTPTVTPTMPVPTSTLPPTATSTALPRIPTLTSTPTITITPTPNIVVVVVTPSPFAPNGESGSGNEEGDNAPTGGACNTASAYVSAWTATANMLFIVAPLGMIAGFRRLRRFGKK